MVWLVKGPVVVVIIFLIFIAMKVLEVEIAAYVMLNSMEYSAFNIISESYIWIWSIFVHIVGIRFLTGWLHMTTQIYVYTKSID